MPKLFHLGVVTVLLILVGEPCEKCGFVAGPFVYYSQILNGGDTVIVPKLCMVGEQRSDPIDANRTTAYHSNLL